MTSATSPAHPRPGAPRPSEPRHRRAPRRWTCGLTTALALGITSSACSRGATSAATNAGSTSASARYTPRTRAITITTVPLLVKEEADVLPFLKEDFATGGVLEGKEVYAFSPSTVSVVEGDTIQFTFINAEDDDHSFVLANLSVPLPPQKITTSTYVAKRPGIYPFVCAVPSHLPMMSGQLVVLSPASVAPPKPSGHA